MSFRLDAFTDANHNLPPSIYETFNIYYAQAGNIKFPCNYICVMVFYHVIYIQLAKMTQLKVYENYVEKLVKCLPMNDDHFVAILSAKQLLLGDAGNKIKQLSTQSDKASYFLNHVIKPALDNDDNSDYFEKLLSVMQNCGYDHVQKLSCEIKCDVNNDLRTGA